MIHYKEAQNLLTAAARSFGKESIGLEYAYGRVLSEAVPADRDYPPFDRATMDGYAIRYSDFGQGIRHFSITETIFAGSVSKRAIGSGQCYKIMTGAAVPPGADTVIRREDTNEHAHAMDIRVSHCRPYQNMSRQGEDIRSGDVAIAAHRICHPAVMGSLASLGATKLLVERLPRVALFTTGDEVLPVEAPVGPVQIRNSNRWVIQALLRKWGITPSRYAHIPDDRQITLKALEEAIQGYRERSGDPDGREAPTAELVILSGGVSAGDADHVPGVLRELGVRELFHKLAMKPGKPVWCGALPNGGLAFGLPGNPFSCMVTFLLFIEHYLHACFGLAAPAGMEIPLQGGRARKTPLDEFFPVHLGGKPARLVSMPINGSGDIRLGQRANALALHPAGSGDLADGEGVLCYDL
jgi:molybdopterin molybdotransferase